MSGSRAATRGSRANEPGVVLEGLESRQMFAADLGVRFDDFSVPQFIVPGGGFNAPILVRNNGPMSANGLVTIRYYASTNNTFDANDVLLGSYDNLPIFLSSQDEGDFSDAAVIPRDMAPGNYFLLVRIIPDGDVNDTNQSNNVAVSDTTMNVSWRFGTIGGAQNVPLKLSDGDSSVDFTWSGPGTGTVTKNMDGSFNVTIENSTAASNMGVVVAGGDGQANIKTLTIPGSFGSIGMTSVNITGSVSVGGTLGRLEARNSFGTPGGMGNSITVTGVGVDTVFKFALVANTSITTNSGIAELALSSKWSDNDSTPDIITAPYLTKLTVNGNFAAGLRLSSSSGPNATPTLGSATITGQAGTNSWWVNGRAGEIKVASTNVFFSASFAGIVALFQTTLADMRGVIASPKFNAVTIAGTVNTGWILGGASLGRDGKLGGAGPNADAYGPGQVLNISIGNKVLRGIIAAGLDPVDGIFDNGNDIIKGGLGAKLGFLTIARTTTLTSRFLAGSFVGTMSINGAAVNPKNDRRFALTEGVAPTAVVVGPIATTGPATIQIKFTDNQLLRLNTIGNTDLKITGPNGFESFLTLVTALPPENSKTWTATFNVSAPGGTWDAADNGNYRVELVAGVFTDLNGNANAAANLRDFTIAI